MRFPSVGVLIAVGCGAARVDAAVASEDLGAGGPPDVEMEAKGKKRGLRKLAEHISNDSSDIAIDSRMAGDDAGGGITVDSWWGDPNGPVWIAPAPPYIAPAPVPVPYTGPYPTPGVPWTGPYPTPGAPWTGPYPAPAPWTGPYPAPAPWTAPWTGPQPNWTPSCVVEPCYIDTEISCVLASTSYSGSTSCYTLTANAGKVNCPSIAAVTSITFKFTAASCASSSNNQAETCIDNIALPDTTSARHIDITQVGGTTAGSKGSGVVAVGGTITATGIDANAGSISVTISGSSAGAGTVYQTITGISLTCAAVTNLRTCDNFGAVEVYGFTNGGGSVTRPTETATFTATNSYPTTVPTGTPTTYLPATSTIDFFTTTSVNGVTTSKELATTAGVGRTESVIIDLCMSQTVSQQATVTGQRTSTAYCVDTTTFSFTYSET